MFYNEDKSINGTKVGFFVVIIALLAYFIIIVLPQYFENTSQSQVVIPQSPPVSKFTVHNGKDIPGNDIECIHSVSSKVCEDKCLANPNCKSYVDVKPGNPWWGGKYGCCYKNVAAPISPLGEQIDAYIRI